MMFNFHESTQYFPASQFVGSLRALPVTERWGSCVPPMGQTLRRCSVTVTQAVPREPESEQSQGQGPTWFVTMKQGGPNWLPAAELPLISLAWVLTNRADTSQANPWSSRHSRGTGTPWYFSAKHLKKPRSIRTKPLLRFSLFFPSSNLTTASSLSSSPLGHTVPYSSP